jgi:hypothetical protein
MRTIHPILGLAVAYGLAVAALTGATSAFPSIVVQSRIRQFCAAPAPSYQADKWRVLCTRADVR